MNSNYLKELFNMAKALHPKDAERVACDLLDDPKFFICSGSVSFKHHHYDDGGLMRHTYEVIKLGKVVVETLGIYKKVDPTEFFLAALYHDAGKMYDYYRMSFPSDPHDMDRHEWISTAHKRDIHHISRSGIIWSRAVAKYPELDKEYHDKVLHAILSHHGTREWGSPVAPHSRVAWLVHMCDQMSARMDDCDKIDLVHEKK